MPPRHPNILKLCSDEHSPFVCGYAGDPWVRTPNLDRLAAEGTVFENCYATNPICVPGRNSMICGKLVRELGTPYYHDVLPLESHTYMRHFAQRGYQTTCVGKQHFHGPEQMYGWMFRPYGDMEVMNNSNIPGYSPDKDVAGELQRRGRGLAHWVRSARPGREGFMLFDESVTREAVLHLEDYYSGMIIPRYMPERPLLYEVSWKTPHWPFIAPPELFDLYRRIVGPPAKPPPENPVPYIRRKHEGDQPDDVTDEQVLNARAAYWGLVEYTDRQVGIVLDALDRLGVRDDFVVMYCSDHGEMAGERGLWGKHCFYEESARVPMILAGPGIPKGRRVRENVSLMDVFATLCDLAGLPAPEDLRGPSMVPLLDGPGAFGERTVFSELYLGEVSSVMAKRGDVKYVCYSDGARELYDLSHDPGEVENLADHPCYAAVQHELHEALAALPGPWRTGDPNWRAPEGLP